MDAFMPNDEMNEDMRTTLSDFISEQVTSSLLALYYNSYRLLDPEGDKAAEELAVLIGGLPDRLKCHVITHLLSLVIAQYAKLKELGAGAVETVVPVDVRADAKLHVGRVLL